MPGGGHRGGRGTQAGHHPGLHAGQVAGRGGQRHQQAGRPGARAGLITCRGQGALQGGL
ncbi:hypothetical protein OF001_U270045 [Pseudomonas sp. OF001]|nr:hypothetical protein OF001_U270045 [Pseudomonas sp. OF001]